MPRYTPPIRDMQFVLHELLDVQAEYAAMPRHAEVSRDLIDQVLVEGGRFCAEVLLPINRSGDEEGCTYEGDGVVRTPKGFKEAWNQFRDAGWPTLNCDPTLGGQGLPATVGPLCCIRRRCRQDQAASASRLRPLRRRT